MCFHRLAVLWEPVWVARVILIPGPVVCSQLRRPPPGYSFCLHRAGPAVCPFMVALWGSCGSHICSRAGSWGLSLISKWLISELLVGCELPSRSQMCSLLLHFPPTPLGLETWIFSYLFLLPHLPPSSAPNAICFPSLLIVV